MARPMPIGTIRSWENGEFIKAHDGSMFHNGWIPLSTSSVLDNIGRICDTLANSMLYQKIPINGEKFLDHEIGEFEKQPGEEFGKYTPDDFKKYEGFAGAARYSFRNEFSRRFMKPKLDIAEKINEELLAANRRRGLELGKTYDQINADDFLTTEEKAEIRVRIRAEVKGDDSYFSVKEAEELSEIVKRTKKQLDQGLNFEGDQKKIYEDNVAIADSLPVKYERIAKKRAYRDQAIADINKAFPDNWGVRESFKFYIEDKYTEYIRRFKDQIIKDEAADQESLFGVKLDEDPSTFYPKLYAKLGSNPDNYPFKELIGLRFETKYDKVLSGDWQPGMLPAIEQIESMLFNTPQGHFMSNHDLKIITQNDYNGGDHGGYAWYSAKERRINLSKNLIKDSSSIWSRLAHLNEFQSTLAHEIGHAVSTKFGREGNVRYKEFVVACGWSYQQEHLRRGMTATGSDRDIPREGSMSHIQLLTDYAHKSPEEAFAEYYSIYHNNKKEIDHWLKTDDSSLLHKVSRTYADSEPSTATVGKRLMYKNTLTPESKHKIDRLIDNVHLDPDKHIKVELISPWGTTVEESDRKNYSVDKVKMRLNQSFGSIPPVIAVEDSGKYEILDGVNRQAQAKFNKKMLPSVSISKEFHTALSSRGISNDEIAKYAIAHRSESIVPKQASIPKTLSGIDYRGHIVPVEHIKNSEGIFRRMKAIYESDELKKALDTLGFF